MPSHRPPRLLAVLLVGVAAYRFGLLGRGALAFVDETFYFTSVKALEAIASRDVTGAVTSLAQARGRTGAAILQIPIAALQAIPAHFGVPASNLRSLLIPTSLNVLVSLLSTYFVFAIGAALTGSEAAALVSTVMYALLVNSNLYVRHVLPYDWALCAGLVALWLAFTRPQLRGLVAWTGVLAGGVLTIYTGYYPFCAVIGVAVLWQQWSKPDAVAVRDTILFAASAAVVVVVTELLFRAGGLSYLANLRDVRRDIAFTSFGDGWTFLPEYLVDVERLSGVVLVLGSVAYAARAAIRFSRGVLRPIDRIALPMLLACAWQAIASAYLHAIPLFGRLLHPWMPFLAWMLADSLAAVSPGRLRVAAFAAVIGAAAISFVLSAREYLPLKYPPDVLYAMGVDTERLTPDHKLCELYPGTSYASPGPLNRTTREPYDVRTDYVLLNFCQALPAVPRPKQAASIPAGTTRLFDGPYWMTFPAYAYEGLTREDRAAIRRDGYRLQVFASR